MKKQSNLARLMDYADLSVSDLFVLDPVRSERPVRSRAVLVYLENRRRSTGKRAGFQQSAGSDTQRVDGCPVRCPVPSHLCGRPHVFSHRGISDRFQYPQQCHAPHRNASAGISGRLRKRQDAQNCQRVQRRHGDISGSSAAGPGGRCCDAGRPSVSPVLFRLASGNSEPHSGGSCFCHHVSDDRTEDEREDERVSECAGGYVE